MLFFFLAGLVAQFHAGLTGDRRLQVWLPPAIFFREDLIMKNVHNPG